ncbi:MAG: thioredoxin domain-containing protein [Syntrophothermus sp.]
MKKISVLLLFLLMLGHVIAQNRKIEFVEKPWKEIQAMAKEQNKIIFLDGFASWCGPCKWMAKNMFTKDSVADFYNKYFICASIDMEKGEGKELAKKYQIRVYPTLLFLDSAGNMLHRKAGAPQRVQDYIELGDIAMNPENRMGTMEKRYQAGERSAEFIYNYVKQLNEAYLPTQQVLEEYFSKQQEKDLINRENWKMIYAFTNSPESREFNYLLQHRQDFINRYAADSVNQKIVSVIENSLTQLIKGGKISDSIYDQAKAQVRALGIPGADKALFGTDLMFYSIKQQKSKFLEVTYNDLDKYYHNDPDMLNNIAWYYTSMTTDPKFLNKATEWSKRANELKKDPSYLDTYAVLLDKTGKKEEAIRQEKSAIELARSQGKTAGQFEARLKEFEK